MKGIRVPPQGHRERVDDDPGDDDERLSDQVLRRAEEARRLLGNLAEAITAVCALEMSVAVVMAHWVAHLAEDMPTPGRQA